MTRLMASFLFLTCVAARGDEQLPSFAGEWKSTFGPVTLEQKGNAVTGRLVFFKLPLSGKVEGKNLTIGYEEGTVHVDAKVSLEPSGTEFKGTFRASNGNRGLWNGWRPDPTAREGQPADFSGLWLTNLGLMELSREGSKVKGRYALRGTSSLEGEIKGRHLDFRIKALRTGPGWFDLDKQGDTLSGAGGTDGMAAWYPWNGRKAPEFVRHIPLVAGTIVDGSTEGLLTYCIRAPESYKPGDTKTWPTVLLLHGSNMNARAYVSTLAATWPDIARDYILLGINGELPSSFEAGQPTFNYTYINYVGRSTFQGFPGTDRESPALVREAMEELKQTYPIRHYFVGGHSQGGYLTYSILMNSPEQIAGAFPISAGVILQCEPSAYENAEWQAAQRKVPLAIIHGKNDPLVPYDSATYAAGLFLEAGWPAFRFLTDDKAAHMFGRLPVDKAIRWLEAMASDDPKVLLDFAESRLKASAYRDVIATLGRAKRLANDTPSQERWERLKKSVEAQAAEKAAPFLTAIRANKDNTWVDGFLTFRDDFEYAEAATEVMAAFHALRDQQAAAGQKTIAEARGFFQGGKQKEGYTKAQEVVDKYYASKAYRLAKKWLAERP